jgi:hypothetical protein
VSFSEVQASKVASLAVVSDQRAMGPRMKLGGSGPALSDTDELVRCGALTLQFRFLHGAQVNSRTREGCEMIKERSAMKIPILVASLAIAFSSPIMAQDLDGDERGLIGSPSETSEASLAQELSNPVAPIISVPLQFNYNRVLGDGDGKRYGLTVSSVIPFQLSDNWNLISSTVIPVVRQHDVTPDGKSQFGFGPVVQSLFFSPITDSDFTWGAGPVLALPTATDGLPGDKWGAGITGVGLVQKGNWTVGALANHIWSVTGDTTSNTFMQPYVVYTTETAWTFLINTEAIYNWESSE